MLCKEFGAGIDNVRYILGLSETGHIRYFTSTAYADYCRSFHLAANIPSTYIASNFRISSPITYFQGETDPATPVESALEHQKQVPLSQSQFILLRDGGHSPLGQVFESRENPQLEPLKNMFLKALAGENILGNDIDAVNERGKEQFELLR